MTQQGVDRGCPFITRDEAHRMIIRRIRTVGGDLSRSIGESFMRRSRSLQARVKRRSPAYWRAMSEGSRSGRTRRRKSGVSTVCLSLIECLLIQSFLVSANATWQFLCTPNGLEDDKHWYG